MLSTAINIGILASVFIKMIEKTMDDRSWSDQDKTSNALFCILGLGAGEIIGSLIFGRITDKCSNNMTILLNVLATSIAYAALILYGAVYNFNWVLAILMTFTWGVQDAAVNCLISSLLGFQFDSKTTPFSVYKFVQNLLIFLVISIESKTQNQLSYLIYFGVCYFIAMVAWAILFKFFKILPNEEVEQMRLAKQAKDLVQHH